jgi:hypothetical protein
MVQRKRKMDQYGCENEIKWEMGERFEAYISITFCHA